MAEKREYMARNLDHLRTALMHEPRGHADMFGAVLTAPTVPRADFGLLFMDGGGYLTMCGHGTIGTAAVLVEISLPDTIAEDVPKCGGVSAD